MTVLDFRPVTRKLELESWEDEPARDVDMRKRLPVYVVTFPGGYPNLFVYARALHSALEVKIPYDRWSRRFIGKYTLDCDYFAAASFTPPFSGADLGDDRAFDTKMAEELAYARRDSVGRAVRRYLRGRWNEFMQGDPYRRFYGERIVTAEDWKAVTCLSRIWALSHATWNLTNFDIGPNRLFAWLRANGHLHRTASGKNKPSREMLDRGLMAVKEGVAVLTGEGMGHFLELFQEMAKTMTGPVNRRGRVRFPVSSSAVKKIAKGQFTLLFETPDRG
jgi:phage anti-repressor protein